MIEVVGCMSLLIQNSSGENLYLFMHEIIERGRQGERDALNAGGEAFWIQ